MMRKVYLAATAIGAAMAFPGAAHAQAAATSATTTNRHYECTTPGKASKAACEGAAGAAPAASATTSIIVSKTTAARHYDSSKPGNANKAACKTAAAPATPVTTAASAMPAATSTHTVQTNRTTHTISTSAATNGAGPNGNAQCKDGTYSHSAHRSGTCAGHKGVRTWY